MCDVILFLVQPPVSLVIAGKNSGTERDGGDRQRSPKSKYSPLSKITVAVAKETTLTQPPH